MTHLDLEDGSIVRILAAQETGVVVSTVGNWCSVRTRSGFHTQPHGEVKYLGTPGWDCPHLSDYEM